MARMSSTWPRSAWVILFVLSIFRFSAIAADRPPIVGIAHVAFQVSDLAKAQIFYGEFLGYEPAFRLYREDGSTSLVYFKVNDHQYIEILPGLPPDQDERLSHVAFETTNLEALRTYLAKKGVQVPEKASKGQDGNMNLTVKDPDGHRVEFVEYLAGSLHMKTRGSYLNAKRISDRILHVGLTVADPTAADRFYKDVLGFSEIWRGGTGDNVTSWINMRLPDGTDYLEYMLVAGKVDRRRLGVFHHVALQVPDMQEALATLRDRSRNRESITLESPHVGRNNRWQLSLYDSDGSRTELMEPFTMR